jgi:hypothetical protein
MGKEIPCDVNEDAMSLFQHEWSEIGGTEEDRLS